MSLPAFPTSLPGLAFDVLRSPNWSTRQLTSRSGKKYLAANWSYGIYTYTLKFTVLRTNLGEFQTLLGFYNQMNGAYGWFAYTDPYDNAVTLQVLGTGTGSQTVFPFVRTFGGFVEPVLNVTSVSQVTVAGSGTSSYTTSQSGEFGIDTLTMNSAPTNGQVVAATFAYSWPCHFLKDVNEFNNFALNRYGLKELVFETLK